MNIYRRLLPYLRPHIGRLVMTTVCMLGFVIFNLASVGLIMPFVDTVFKQVPAETAPSEEGSFGLTDLKAAMNAMIDEWITQHDRVEVLQWLVVLIVLSFLLKNLFGVSRGFFMADV